MKSSFWTETSSLFELSVSASSKMSCCVLLEHFFQPRAAFFWKPPRKPIVSSQPSLFFSPNENGSVCLNDDDGYCNDFSSLSYTLCVCVCVELPHKTLRDGRHCDLWRISRDWEGEKKVYLHICPLWPHPLGPCSTHFTKGPSAK